MLPQRATEIEDRWLDVEDPLGAPVRSLVAWLSKLDAPAAPAALKEAARGSELEPLIDELMTGLLDKSDDWDWNAHFELAAEQLREKWRLRRKQALSARSLGSLSESERSELTELARS
jgi:DNA primase